MRQFKERIYLTEKVEKIDDKLKMMMNELLVEKIFRSTDFPFKKESKQNYIGFASSFDPF